MVWNLCAQRRARTRVSRLKEMSETANLGQTPGVTFWSLYYVNVVGSTLALVFRTLSAGVPCSSTPCAGTSTSLAYVLSSP